MKYKRPLIKLLLTGLLALLGGAVALLASGCTVGKPFRGPGFDPRQGVVAPGAGDTVTVAVTHAVLNGSWGDRRVFDRHLWRVVDQLPEFDGLVGYSVRKEVFGNEAWTLSVWTDEASLGRFVDSLVHRDAVDEGGKALEAVRFARARLPADAMPIDWQLALAMLDEQNSPATSR